MKKDMTKALDLMKDFSSTRARISIDVNESKPPSKPKTPNRNYTSYQKKIESGDLSKFSTQDMMFFFRDTANRNGVKYVISKPQIEMRNFKLCKERGYTIEEILLMIEFLYESDQNYLDKTKLHPGIILTGWCNKIYEDSKLWLNDEYHIDVKKTQQGREWTEEVPTDSTEASIGQWGL